MVDFFSHWRPKCEFVYDTRPVLNMTKTRQNSCVGHSMDAVVLRQHSVVCVSEQSAVR